MKKLSKLLLLFILTIPFIVSAKDCTIISGTGKNIGDEVACGTEHFYVISNDGTNAKLLAKYNLLAGATYNNVQPTSEYKSNSYNGLYDYAFLIPEVKENIKNGYTLEEVQYIYETDSNTNTSYYNMTGVAMAQYYYEERTGIVFDTPKNNEIEVINSAEAKEVFEKGYGYDASYKGEKGYYGATFFKETGYEYKTIVFDSEQFLTIKEFFEKDGVKELLDEGYYYYKFGRSAIRWNSEKTMYSYYGASFYKSIYYDYTTILFDEDVITDDIDSYLETNTEVQEKIKDGYTIYQTYQNSVTNLPYIGVTLRKSKDVRSEYGKTIVQNELTVGIHGDEFGKPDYPFYGVIDNDTELMDFYYESEFHDGETYGGGYYQDFDAETYSYLQYYLDNMKDNEYDIKKVSMLSVKELSEIIEKETGNPIPLEEWYENKTYIEQFNIYQLGNLKTLLGDKLPWLYSTTYWLRTLPTDDSNTLFQINTLGDLCTSYLCNSHGGSGIRPVITLASNNLVYKIFTKTDGNGSVDSSSNTSLEGETITFTIKPSKGFVLGEVKVYNENGDTIEISLENNSFTMPNSNVTIEATFVPYNPDTSDINIIVASIMTIMGTIIIISSYKKMSWLNQN